MDVMPAGISGSGKQNEGKGRDKIKFGRQIVVEMPTSTDLSGTAQRWQEIQGGKADDLQTACKNGPYLLL